MAELPWEELLSAYLDGELTAEEQARVEHSLASDDRAQRLLEEMRAVRESIQQLPRLSLPADFCQHVLRQAERRMLEQPDPVLPGAIGSSDNEPLARPADERPFSERVRRPLLYSMLAVSVALLITMFNPDPTQQDAPRSVATAPRAGSAESLMSRGGTEAGGFGSAAAGDVSTPSISAPNYDAASESLPKGPPLPAVAPPFAEQFETARKAGQDRAAMAGKDSEAAAKAVQDPGDMRAKLPAANAAGEIGQAQVDGLLVVECQVSPLALQNEAFQKVLDRQQVSWRYATAPADQLDPLSDERRAPPRAQRAVELSLQDNEPSGASPSVKLLYVEATPEQMEQTLAELSSQPDDFPSVTVDPAAASGLQQRWQNQYSRRRLEENNVRLYADSDARSNLAPSTNQAIEKASPAAAAGANASQQDQAKSAGNKASETPAEVADRQAEPAARPEPSAPAERTNKQGAPSNRLTENNLSRARSYTIPQQQQRRMNRSELENEVVPPKDDTAMRDKQQAPGASSNSNRQQSSRQSTSEAKLRALFVLQLPETDNTATPPPVSSEAAAKQQPARASQARP